MKTETKMMLNVAFKSVEIEDVTMKDKCCWCVLVFDYHNAIFEMLKERGKMTSLRRHAFPSHASNDSSPFFGFHSQGFF